MPTIIQWKRAVCQTLCPISLYLIQSLWSKIKLTLILRKWSWKKQKLNYRENNWIYGIALNFSPGVHKNKRIIIYMAFMKYKTIWMTEILIDGGLSRINKTEGLLIYSHPLQKCHNFISFQSLLNHFLKLKLKQKIPLGVKFPIHTLSWMPVKVT